MTTLNHYSSYNEIRATLGVSDEELEDATLALPIWYTQLQLSLEDIDDGLPANFLTVYNIEEVSRTALQQKFFRTVQLFSAYAVAKDLLTSLPLFSFKRVTDGKAEAERFDAWEDTRSGVLAGFNTMKSRLSNLLPQIDNTFTAPAEPTFVFVRATGLATDPITS